MKNFNWGGRGMLSQAESGPYFLPAKKYAKSSSLKTFDTTLVHPTTTVKNFEGDIFRRCTDVLRIFNSNAKLIVSTIFCVLFSGLLVSSAFGQEANCLSKIKPLQIGDTIPEELWNLPLQVVNHPDGRDTITLNDYRSKKLIILDFWATWCGSCIENIPHVLELQEKFKNDFKAIFVNSKRSRDTKSKIESFLLKRESYTGNKLVFSSIVQDTVFTELFPYRFIPHYVWLVDGRVVAITSAKEINQKNIQMAIDGHADLIYTKRDILNFDPKEPLFTYVHQEMKSPRLFQSTLIGEIEGAGKWTGKNTDVNGHVYRYYFFNKTLLDIMQVVFPESRTHRNKLIIDGEEMKKSLLYDSLFCYELITKPMENGPFLDFLKLDLQRCLGADIKREKRGDEVWILTKTKNVEILRSKSEKSSCHVEEKAKEKYIKNMPVSSLLGVLNTFSPIPVIDETGITYTIDIDLPASLYDISIEESNSYLLKYGLKLVKGNREVEFTIINLKNINHD